MPLNIILLGAGIILELLIGYFVVSGNKSSEAAAIMASVKKGQFKVEPSAVKPSPIQTF